MAIKVTSYEPHHEALVCEFNARMEASGSDWRFYEHAKPKWLPAGVSPRVRRDYYVAIDDDDLVRAGYCLKPEEFALRGEPIEFASIQGPVSEGLVDRAYGMLAFQLIRDMEARSPRLFVWGTSDRMMQLLNRLKWKTFPMPFLVRVVKAGRVLRNFRYGADKPKARGILNLLASTGLGAIGFTILQAGIRFLSRPIPFPIPSVEVVEEDQFGDWADEVWEGARVRYQLLAWRDAESMNARLPRNAWPNATILRILRNAKTVGWAAIRDTQFKDDARFGDLRVGLVVDALALPGWEVSTVAAATGILERRGVDAIVSYFTHPIWLKAFKISGFIMTPRNRPFQISPTMVEAIGDEAIITEGLHLTPLDGDGPLGM